LSIEEVPEESQVIPESIPIIEVETGNKASFHKSARATPSIIPKSDFEDSFWQSLG
jgi:hypothetical protein